MKTGWRHPSRLPWRILQKVSGVHRIHHIRFAFGWKLPFSDLAYFPAWSTRGAEPVGFPARWEHVNKADYHDCTSTGSY